MAMVSAWAIKWLVADLAQQAMAQQLQSFGHVREEGLGLALYKRGVVLPIVAGAVGIAQALVGSYDGTWIDAGYAPHLS